MSRIPRYFIGLIVSIIIFAVFIYYRHIQPESYTPPPLLYKYAIANAHGTVTGKATKDLGDHLLEGSNTFYWIDYTFTPPHIKVIDSTGQTKWVKPEHPYIGSVRIDQTRYESTKTGDPVQVVYDPIDPKINGVPDSFTKWSKYTGYFNPYLWWLVGVLGLMFIVQEIIRLATRTSDL